MVGLSSTPPCFSKKPTYTCFAVDCDDAAVAAQLGRTRKEILMQKCVKTWPKIFLGLNVWLSSFLQAGIKWRPSLSEVAELGPEFREHWNNHFSNAPDKPVLWMGFSPGSVLDYLDCQITYHSHRQLSGASSRCRATQILHCDCIHCESDIAYSFPHFNAPITAYARAGIPSRSRLRAHHRRSRSLCADKLCPWLSRIVSLSLSLTYSTLLQIVYSFNRKADVQPLVLAYKFSREIARRMPHFRGEPPMQHPTFVPGSPASIIEHAKGPVSFDAPRIVYSEDDEHAIEAFARANGTWLLPLSVFLFLYNTTRLLLRRGVVATAWHSVSSLLLCAVRGVVERAPLRS